MRNKVVLAAIFICAFGADDAHAHCFSRWFYPWPQRCGVIRPARVAAPMRVYDPGDIPLPPAKEIDIPLPDMTFEACGDADDRTELRLRLLLRAHLDGKGE